MYIREALAQLTLNSVSTARLKLPPALSSGILAVMLYHHPVMPLTIAGWVATLTTGAGGDDDYIDGSSGNDSSEANDTLQGYFWQRLPEWWLW